MLKVVLFRLSPARLHPLIQKIAAISSWMSSSSLPSIAVRVLMGEFSSRGFFVLLLVSRWPLNAGAKSSSSSHLAQGQPTYKNHRRPPGREPPALGRRFPSEYLPGRRDDTLFSRDNPTNPLIILGAALHPRHRHGIDDVH
ncbi:hypothetical protein Y032_0232g3053 [Ancylostoma ceylanicum]|uniref:Uncharacterized protein n=1 Tax=Ancylostoma ceylanicum TaxID=53326 RepID=A0A016SGL1_9BILA|nr:hypothetical protein Y032_0232g3053 [Ancylostoma ceylanicum]